MEDSRLGPGLFILAGLGVGLWTCTRLLPDLLCPGPHTVGHNVLMAIVYLSVPCLSLTQERMSI